MTPSYQTPGQLRHAPELVIVRGHGWLAYLQRCMAASTIPTPAQACNRQRPMIYLIIRSHKSMTPLEYLVPSRARRQLLAALWAHPQGLSMRALSREAVVAYSAAHRELSLMVQAGLVLTQGQGHALVCRWNRRSPTAKRLEQMLCSTDAQHRDEEDSDTVYGNLRRWGAPLMEAGTPAKELSLEETLARALSLARHRPEVARVWPVVLAKHRTEVDLDHLEALANRFGQKKALGFFLALSGRLLGDRRLSRTASRLRDDRYKKVEDFFRLDRGERARKLAGRNTPALAKRWLYRMNMPLESFESTFRKFVERPA